MTGDVFGQSEIPLVLTKGQFLEVLTDLMDWIREDDSMGGRLAYEWGPVPGTYNVVGVLQMGNSQGQGAIRMLVGDPPRKRLDPVVAAAAVAYMDERGVTSNIIHLVLEELADTPAEEHVDDLPGFIDDFIAGFAETISDDLE